VVARTPRPPWQLVFMLLFVVTSCDANRRHSELFAPQLSFDSVPCHSSIGTQLCAELNAAIDSIAAADDQGDVCDGKHTMVELLIHMMENDRIRYSSSVATAEYNYQTQIITLGQTTLQDHYAKVFNLTHEYRHMDVGPSSIHGCENFADPVCNRPDSTDNFSLNCANVVTGENRGWH
jgi:hypothetical protein